MTDLTKPVRRKTNIRMGSRPLIIQIEPETPEKQACIRLRERGAHRWYDLPIRTAYILAINLARKETKAAKRKRK